MIRYDELAQTAAMFAGYKSCYLKGFWGQELTKAEYDRVLKMYPENAKYKNESLIGTNVFPFDCICFVKALLGGATPERRLSYKEMAAGPLGDCTTQKFKSSLYDCIEGGGNIPAGYGIASDGHAAISLGSGRWIDANYDGVGQNGLKIHSGGVPSKYVCGKIPGIDYTPAINEVEDFLAFLYKSWKDSKG